ncbi:class I SAM-dependent methyltransferase [Paenibacillus xerothermodurans]|uniref:class I SAM-dependent methyltransferase n=1 Tax=Paenibacillus xerothermodurans TaxID=1977292 RepID=UPI001FB3791E|nr:class I SAM-dependent methyltransferase [Paenibacillus xerothermodurans]
MAVTIWHLIFTLKRITSTYAGREADRRWENFITAQVRIKGATVADIGCGGGIYTKALAQLQAGQVKGVDFSRAMLNAAAQHCAGVPTISFALGSAVATELSGETADVILERALIHHLSATELADCFREARRVLKQDGTLIVQDRTPDDCLLPGGKEHLRGHFFEKFPQLTDIEIRRRHSAESVEAALREAGFNHVQRFYLWETRKRYTSFADFRIDLLARTGRSLLHELCDTEMEELAGYIQQRTGCADDEPLYEQDRWTVWIAKKH